MRILAPLLMMVACGGAARADLEPGHVVNKKATKTQREAAKTASDAAESLVKGDFNGAMSLADRALAVDGKDPWAHYVRAESLVRLGKHDFPAEERWSKSIALWGRANAFYQLGRCEEAKTAFTEYIGFVKSDDRPAADLAQTRIDGCRPPWVAPATPAAPAGKAP
jgi:Flp pilus assembly protein TadD